MISQRQLRAQCPKLGAAELGVTGTRPASAERKVPSSHPLPPGLYVGGRATAVVLMAEVAASTSGSVGKQIGFAAYSRKPTSRGIGTRSVDELVKAMGLDWISKSEASRLCAEIDERVQSFLCRPIERDWPYLWLDATYVKARRDHHVVSVAVIIVLLSIQMAAAKCWS